MARNEELLIELIKVMGLGDQDRASLSIDVTKNHISMKLTDDPDNDQVELEIEINSLITKYVQSGIIKDHSFLHLNNTYSINIKTNPDENK